jgi:DNA polymerase-3 subunit epsilon/ATP-dependent DNA helicase DinG
VLFSANDELESLYNSTKDRLLEIGIKSFAQGIHGQPSSVLSSFMATPNSVLFGSKSFFEGVDIQGQKLQLVIINKIPFPMEGDPIIGARKIKAGDKAFVQVNYHDAVIDLKQATGRLIRSKNDRGVVAILDSRIWNKSYGGKILNDLPFVNKTADLNLTLNYLRSLSKWQPPQ